MIGVLLLFVTVNALLAGGFHDDGVPVAAVWPIERVCIRGLMLMRMLPGPRFDPTGP